MLFQHKKDWPVGWQCRALERGAGCDLVREAQCAVQARGVDQPDAGGILGPHAVDQHGQRADGREAHVSDDAKGLGRRDETAVDKMNG